MWNVIENWTSIGNINILGVNTGFKDISFFSKLILDLMFLEIKCQQ